MQVAITGHTGTIGGYLYNNLDNCIGFSRSNGYDIRDEDTQDRIVLESHQCDVFINCAHGGPGTAQTDLLWKIYRRWQDQPKHIINIGTDAVPTSVWSKIRADYPLEKSILASTVDHIQQDPKSCKVSIINPRIVTDHMLIDILNTVELMINSSTLVASVNIR